MPGGDPDESIYRVEGRLRTGDQLGQFGLSLPPGQRAERLRSAEAAQLADLLSIANDVNRVTTRCDLLLDDDVPIPDEVRDGLWEACLITYRRSFTRGRPAMKNTASRDRRRLTDGEMAVFDADDWDVHHEILRQADKHVAHRVDNDSEQTAVVAILDSAGERLGLAVMNARQVSTGRGEIEGLRRISSKLYAHLAELIDIERKTL